MFLVTGFHNVIGTVTEGAVRRTFTTKIILSTPIASGSVSSIHQDI